MPYAGGKPGLLIAIRRSTWHRISSEPEQRSVRDLIEITELVEDEGRRLLDFVSLQLAKVGVGNTGRALDSAKRQMLVVTDCPEKLTKALAVHMLTISSKLKHVKRHVAKLRSLWGVRGVANRGGRGASS